MAGDGANNESKEGVEESASARGEREPHSRVGGRMECDHHHNNHNNRNNHHNNTLDNKNSTSTITTTTTTSITSISDCRSSTTTSPTSSFIEICQIRLLHLFPHLSHPPNRYNVCKDSIERTAERLGNDVISYLLKEDLYLISKDAVSRSMRHNVHQMLNKHSILFTSMVNRLNVVPDTAYEAFMAVADELFYNGGITWARILCLYAFMGRLALWARDRRMYALKKKLPSYVSRYVGEEIAHFIKGYGGWEQLCIEYPVAEEVSGAVWRSLLMTGATLGLIATILTVAS